MRQMDLQLGHYQFTRNWFRNRNLATFREKVHPEWAGKPIVYLELGVFEGQSLCWMLEHVLTHPDSRAVGVDPWLMTEKLNDDLMSDVMTLAYNNVRAFNCRCQLYRANSAEILRIMNKQGFAGITKNSLDICLIDGNHNALAVLDDCLLVLQLMKPGGWMMFDDVVNAHEKKDHVKQGLEMFLAQAGDRVKEVWKHGHMECYQRAL